MVQGFNASRSNASRSRIQIQTNSRLR